MRGWVVVVALAVGPRAYADAGPIPPETRQLVVVAGDGWDAPSARLQRFERAAAGWRAVGPSEVATVGKRGLAWGAGLHRVPVGAKTKREGDRRAPAGVFRLPGGFGYEPRATRIPWQVVTEDTECVDDAESAAYNTITDRRIGQAPGSTPSWRTGEQMRRKDDLYRYGLYVEHNARPIVRGAGSCIFVHVTTGSPRGSLGCTELRVEAMVTLVDWLDATQAPVLVQLPRVEYERLRVVWSLPPLSR